MTSYPVYVTNLDDDGAVVVGAGPATERKVEGLLAADAHVTLIAPDPPTTLQEWAADGRIDWVERSYDPGDLERAALVIVTASGAVAEKVWAEAQERNVLINTTGDDERSTFANGACIRRGPLVVSVSTSGAAPTVSVRLREQMADRFGPEYETFLEMMDALREPMQAHVDDFATRRDRWYQLVDSDVLELLRKGRPGEARERVRSIVGADVAAALNDGADDPKPAASTEA